MIFLVNRFTFFDQIHTTGIDIKQSPTARAVITIGKDMVFRDYAQGAYRMRGIGKGQTIHLYLVPEVIGLVSQTLQSCSAETGWLRTLLHMTLVELLTSLVQAKLSSTFPLGCFSIPSTLRACST